MERRFIIHKVRQITVRVLAWQRTNVLLGDMNRSQICWYWMRCWVWWSSAKTRSSLLRPCRHLSVYKCVLVHKHTYTVNVFNNACPTFSMRAANMCKYNIVFMIPSLVMLFIICWWAYLLWRSSLHSHCSAATTKNVALFHYQPYEWSTGRLCQCRTRLSSQLT